MKESIILITRGYASERASGRRADEENERQRARLERERGTERRKESGGKCTVLGRPFPLLPPPEFISDPKR